MKKETVNLIKKKVSEYISEYIDETDGSYREISKKTGIPTKLIKAYSKKTRVFRLPYYEKFFTGLSLQDDKELKEALVEYNKYMKKMFDEIYSKYFYFVLYNIKKSIDCFPGSESDDLVQDIYLCIWNRLDELDTKKVTPMVFINYVVKSVFNVRYKHMNAKKRFKPLDKRYVSDIMLTDDNYEELNFDLVNRILEDKILNKEEKLIFEKRFVKGYTLREIGTQLKITGEAVRLKEDRIIKKIREKYNGEK